MPRLIRPLLVALLATLVVVPIAPALDGDRRPPKRHERCMTPFAGWLVLDGVVRNGDGGASLTVRFDRGESGVGRIGKERFRFDSTCHVYRASGRWLPHRPLSVRVRLRSDIAFSTRTGSGPRVGDRVAITLSSVARADARGISASRMRALDVLGRR